MKEMMMKSEINCSRPLTSYLAECLEILHKYTLYSQQTYKKLTILMLTRKLFAYYNNFLNISEIPESEI